MEVSIIYNKQPRVISGDKTVREALELMLANDHNSLAVTEPDNRLIGVLSLQDIAAATVPADMQERLSLAASMYKKEFFAEMCKEVGSRSVSEVMRTDFHTVSPASNIMEVAADFLEHDLYLVPVVENGVLVGVVSRSEIKRALALGMELQTN
jgi:CBS domain-containing protein